MYFVDRNQIEKALVHIESLLALYNEEGSWNQDLIHRLALTRLSHDVIEAILDVGNSMIDGFIMRDPGSYEDIIDIMDDEKVISKEMTEPIKRVIQLRQMIVRDFLQVDFDRMIDTIDQSFDALSQFTTKVRLYLENELGPVSAFYPTDDK